MNHNLINNANDNIFEIFQALGFDIDEDRCYTSDIRMCCPIHDGDNPTAFSYNTIIKRWRCFTHGCHEKNDTIIGFIAECLNKNNNNNNKQSTKDAERWLITLLKLDDTQDMLRDPLDFLLSRMKQDSYLHRQMELPESKMDPVPLDKVKIEKDIYFHKLGFSQETIKKFHIGFCNDYRKPMAMRAFAPVLDETGKMMIGVTGRIIYDKCKLCKLYHKPGNGCPSDGICAAYPKWKHWGFRSGVTLYNIWNAKDHISKTKVAIITEGPKDVWWLDQHGIYNTVAIFGKEIGKMQIQKLIKLGAIKLALALDNDEVGKAANDKMTKLLNRYFQVTSLSHIFKDYKDIGETPGYIIENEIIPIMKQLESQYA